MLSLEALSLVEAGGLAVEAWSEPRVTFVSAPCVVSFFAVASELEPRGIVGFGVTEEGVDEFSGGFEEWLKPGAWVPFGNLGALEVFCSVPFSSAVIVVSFTPLLVPLIALAFVGLSNLRFAARKAFEQSHREESTFVSMERSWS